MSRECFYFSEFNNLCLGLRVLFGTYPAKTHRATFMVNRIDPVWNARVIMGNYYSHRSVRAIAPVDGCEVSAAGLGLPQVVHLHGTLLQLRIAEPHLRVL